MSGLRNVFEIGRRALNVQQALLDRTAHNIANVNTEGYSRQRLSLESDSVVISDKVAVGGGVNVVGVERIQDRFVEKQIQTQSHTLGWFDTYKTAFDRLETIISEPSDSGLSAAMTEFFDAWHGLSNDPESAVARESVLMRGKSLSSSFHATYNRINDFKEELYSDFDLSVAKFNDMLDELADINRASTYGDDKGSIGGLLDKRDMILQEMSKMANISVAVEDSGTVLVSHNGSVILQNVYTTHLVAGTDPNDISQVRWENQTALAGFENGSFAAYIDLHESRLDELMGELDTLANAIVENVNEQHKLGTSIEETAQSGYNFFAPSTTGAADIWIAQEVEEDVLKISASLDGNSGDGGNAHTISQLINEKVLIDETTRFHDYFSNTVAKVGAESAHYQTMAEGQELFVDQLKIRRAEISGVSLDEEMTNLILFQRAYQAAARVITAADEMYDVLFNSI